MTALLLALTLLGCDEGESETEEPATTPAAEAPAVASFFPLHPGDRWRIEGDDGTVRLEAVTGVDQQGVAVVHGTDHLHVERYVSDEDGVFLVTPEGRRLSPILEAPLLRERRFEYELEERDVRVRCDVVIGSIDDSEEVAGRRLSPCVSLTRRCRYPAGAPFPTETTHTRDEVYCRGVGLVRERGVFRPPPSPGAMAADRSERVVGFRVAEGPEPPEGGCDRYILLPSDVAAACGPDVRASADGVAAGEERPSGGCAYALSHGSAALEAVIGAPKDEAPAAALVSVEAGTNAAWLTGPEAACREPERLAPLLSSLL
jgi:hypothetical protein